MFNEEKNLQHSKMNAPDDFEARLASMLPHAAGLDRDRLIFALGEAAGRRLASRSTWQRWAWPAATAMMTAAATVAVALAIWPAGRDTQQVAATSATSPDPETTAAARPRAPAPAEEHPLPSVWPPQARKQPSPQAFAAMTAYLNARQAHLAGQLDERPGNRPATDSDSGNAAPPMSQREMLNTLLGQPAEPPLLPSFNLPFFSGDKT